MPRIIALVLNGRPRGRFAGLDLIERAVLTASRAGAEHVYVVDSRPIDDAIVRRLHARRIGVTVAQRVSHPFEYVPRADLVMVLSASTVVQPAALRGLCRSALDANASVMVDDDVDTSRGFAERAAPGTAETRSNGVLVIADDDLDRVRAAADLAEALHELATAGRLRAVPVAPFYCTRLFDRGDVPRVEREYLRHTNGGDGEGFFTRNIRAFSIPATRLLVRLPITANHVTILGFGLSLIAGIAFSHGTYAAGLIGALLYWTSMVLDCSDGEVARVKLGDSRFGAWLETFTDYLSYFTVLGGILAGDVHAEGFSRHAAAAAIGGVTTLVIMFIVGYLRVRIARENPGALDDALATDLRRGTRLQQFAGWGRQLIKRSFLAHLIVFQAVIGQLPALTEIWACGAIGALLVLLAVQSHLIRSVRVEPLASTTTP